MNSLRLVFSQEYFQFRVGFSEPVQQRWQQERGDCRYYAKTQGARQWFFSSSGDFHQAFNVPETKPCLGRNILAGFRNGHLPIGSINKLHIEYGFEILNRRTEG
jgi:hypothetical protein